MLPYSGPVRTWRPPMPTARTGILVLHHPGADVEEVDVLLDVEVAGEPGEVVPVAHLPVHVGPVGLALLDPDAAAVVVGLQRVDLADRAVVDPLDDLLEPVASSAGTARRRPRGSSSSPLRRFRARSGRRGHRRRPAFRRRRACRHRRPPSGACGRKCGGVASRTTSTPLAMQLLVGVEADELPFGRHVDLPGQAVLLLQAAEARLPAGRRTGRPWRRA